MKLNLERDVLADALRIVAPAIPKVGALAVLACVRLDVDVEAGTATFTATDLDLTITHVVDGVDPAEDEAGTVLAPARLLSQLVGTLPHGAVQLGEYQDELIVIAGDVEARLRTQPTDMWPVPGPVAPATIDLGESDLDHLRAILPMASTDMARAALMAVHFTAEGAYTTDSYRLGQVRLAATVEDRASVAATSVAAVLRVAGDGVSFAIDGRRAHFAAGATAWSCNLVEADHPNVDNVIRVAEAGTHELTVARVPLADAVHRVTSLGLDDADAAGKKIAGVVRLTIEGDKVTVRAGRTGVGSVEEVLSCTCGWDGTIAFNPSFLLELLAAATSDDVTIRLTDRVKPVVAIDGDRLLLLMPVNVK